MREETDQCDHLEKCQMFIAQNDDKKKKPFIRDEENHNHHVHLGHLLE